jgi:hypothetical protein
MASDDPLLYTCVDYLTIVGMNPIRWHAFPDGSLLGAWCRPDGVAVLRLWKEGKKPFFSVRNGIQEKTFKGGLFGATGVKELHEMVRTQSSHPDPIWTEAEGPNDWSLGDEKAPERPPLTDASWQAEIAAGKIVERATWAQYHLVVLEKPLRVFASLQQDGPPSVVLGHDGTSWTMHDALSDNKRPAPPAPILEEFLFWARQALNETLPGPRPMHFGLG